MRGALVVKEGVDLVIAVPLGEVDEDERRVPVLQRERTKIAALEKKRKEKKTVSLTP